MLQQRFSWPTTGKEKAEDLRKNSFKTYKRIRLYISKKGSSYLHHIHKKKFSLNSSSRHEHRQLSFRQKAFMLSSLSYKVSFISGPAVVTWFDREFMVGGLGDFDYQWICQVQLPKADISVYMNNRKHYLELYLLLLIQLHVEFTACCSFDRWLVIYLMWLPSHIIYEVWFTPWRTRTWAN